MGSVIPVAVMMTPGWVNFFVMTGAFLLVALGGLIWMFFFRPSRRRRRKHRHHHQPHPADFAFPQKNGLPPDRREAKISAPPPTHSS
jgi:hypothetical protein